MKAEGGVADEKDKVAFLVPMLFMLLVRLPAYEQR